MADSKYRQRKNEIAKIYFKRNKKAIKQCKKICSERNRLIAIKYKEMHPCICGENDWRCLDFHHLNTKKYLVSKLLTNGNNINTLINEINKCAIICANCHNTLIPKKSPKWTWRIKRLKWINKIKSDSGCNKCNNTNPHKLVFHHIGEKSFSFSGIGIFNHSKEDLIKEISRCIVLCYNCHRKHHIKWIDYHIATVKLFGLLKNKEKQKIKDLLNISDI